MDTHSAGVQMAIIPPTRNAIVRTSSPSSAGQGPSTTELIAQKIAELGDWRGKTLGRMREFIRKADPHVVEEWK